MPSRPSHRIRMLAVIVTACLLPLQGPSHAYVAKDPWAELPVLVHVGGIGTSWTSDAIEALRAWNSGAGVAIYSWSKSRYYRRSCDDDIVTVTWESDDCKGKDMRPKTLAQTYKWTRGGRIVKADVYFNTDLRWGVYDGKQPRKNRAGDDVMDFRRVALHEFGHLLGLGHAPGQGRVIMNAHVSDVDHLTRDDIDGARALYAHRGTGSRSSGQPDLQMGSFRLSARNVRPPHQITLRTTVRNIGSGVAAATRVNYYYWDSRERDWRKLNVFSTVRSLRARQSASQSARLRLPASLALGSHHLAACVLAVDREVDRGRDETNNCDTASFFVQ